MNNASTRWALEELRFLGFPDHTQEVQQKAAPLPGKFEVSGQVKFPNYGTEESMSYNVRFKLSPEAKEYHAYALHATLDNSQQSRMFGMTYDAGFTLRDTFNLLQGRAVHKMTISHLDRKMVPLWFQLDFNRKDVHGNYALNQFERKANEYALGTELSQQGVQQMNDPTKRVNLILSLYQGNTEKVTTQLPGHSIIYVAADPANRAVRLYSGEGKEISQTPKRPEPKQENRQRRGYSR